MGVGLKAFTEFFAYECPLDKGASCRNTIKSTSYIPVLGGIFWFAVLKTEKNEQMPKAEKSALKARTIISISGFGFLLIPVDLIGTIIKMAVFCHKCRKGRGGQGNLQRFEPSQQEGVSRSAGNRQRGNEGRGQAGLTSHGGTEEDLFSSLLGEGTGPSGRLGQGRGRFSPVEEGADEDMEATLSRVGRVQGSDSLRV